MKHILDSNAVRMVILKTCLTFIIENSRQTLLDDLSWWKEQVAFLKTGEKKKKDHLKVQLYALKAGDGMEDHGSHSLSGESVW